MQLCLTYYYVFYFVHQRHVICIIYAYACHILLYVRFVTVYYFYDQRPRFSMYVQNDLSRGRTIYVIHDVPIYICVCRRACLLHILYTARVPLDMRSLVSYTHIVLTVSAWNQKRKPQTDKSLNKTKMLYMESSTGVKRFARF